MKALMKLFFKTNRENWAPILLESFNQSPRLKYLVDEIQRHVTPAGIQPKEGPRKPGKYLQKCTTQE